MVKAMKALAILALVLTIAGALAVLYGINTLTPAVAQVTVAAVPAAQAQDTFDAVRAQTRDGLFMGRTFADLDGVRAEDAWFVTVSVRLDNKGFFPAEWVSLTALPREESGAGARDVLQLDNPGANVLAPRSQGDISATLLTTIPPDAYDVVLEMSCYVLGQRRTVRIEAKAE